MKSDGTFLYATTDVAALFHRTKILKKDMIIYCTDKSQESHFKNLFDFGKIMDWISEDISIFHKSFGVVRDISKKKLSSRDGNPYPMEQLLDETEKFAREKVNEHYFSRANSQVEMSEIAQAVAFNSIRYNDLL